MLIGLTGTFGSGKSAAAAIFQECGAATIDTDAIAHEAVRPGTEALEKLRRKFGDAYLLPDGSLDRKRMAKTVFADEERREALNAIVHPYVIREMNRRIEEIQAAGTATMIVLNVPLLFEYGLERQADKTVVVTISEAERVRRVRARDGLSDEEIARRVLAQWPQEKKAARADAVIDNSGSLEATRLQIHRLYDQWSRERKN